MEKMLSSIGEMGIDKGSVSSMGGRYHLEERGQPPLCGVWNMMGCLVRAKWGLRCENGGKRSMGALYVSPLVILSYQEHPSGNATAIRITTGMRASLRA